jgi:hypothetical protein
MARPKRFELLTPRFVVWCSIQLSYGRVSDFSRLPHSADERAAFRLSTRRPGGRFFLFGRDDIGGAKAQGKSRSPLGRRPAFCAQPASERSARCRVQSAEVGILACKSQSLWLRRSRSSRIFFMSASTISLPPGVAKVVLCPQPSLVRALLTSPRRESTSVGRK